MKALWLPQIVFNTGGGGDKGNGGGNNSSPSTSQTTVKSGDSLSKIAAANNTSVAAIVAKNPKITNVNKIQVGQKLVIPKNTGESTYAGGIGASGSGRVRRNKDGSISVATGSKTSTKLNPIATGGIEPVETSTPTFSNYKPGQAVNQATGKATTTKNAAGQTVKVAANAPKNMKPDIFGYGYYDRNTGAWIPPEIDRKNGGGPGYAGEVFGSGGGQKADTNNDGYITREEAEAADSGFKYGIGAATNALGATPFGSGKKPTGIAGALGNTMYGKLAGYDPDQVQQRFGPGQSMTQAEINEFLGGTPEEVAERRAEQSRQAQEAMSNNDDNQPAAPESTEVVGTPGVQCPEGYMFDSEKNACVIDPFAQPFQPAPAVAGGAPAAPAAATLSPYTASLPTNLSALNPSYTAGQQAVTAGSPIALSAIQPQMRTLPAGNVQQSVPGYPPGFTPRPNPLVGGPGLAGLMVPPIASV